VVAGIAPVRATALVERLASRVEGPQEQGAYFRRQAPAEHHHAVLILVDVQRPARVLACGLPRFCLPVHAAPAPHDALDVGRRAGTPDGQQPGFGRRGGHAGQGADLGVGELPARQGLGETRQRAEGARHPHPLPGGAQLQPHAPGEPGSAGAKAGVPPAAGVEGADEVEEATRRRLEVRRELRDLVTQAIQLRGALRGGL